MDNKILEAEDFMTRTAFKVADGVVIVQMSNGFLKKCSSDTLRLVSAWASFDPVLRTTIFANAYLLCDGEPIMQKCLYEKRKLAGELLLELTNDGYIKQAMNSP